MEDHDVIVECAKYVLDTSRDDFGTVSNSIMHRSHSTMELAMALGTQFILIYLFVYL